jgi:hypothetical protein
MPRGRAIKSKAQQRLLFAKQDRGELKRGTANRMARETPNLRKLPNRVGPKRGLRRASRQASRMQARRSGFRRL